ncbi:MAG: hydroxyacid dehydrogenase [Chloroflexi bacterium]|nr:hydroxyacid dehydrogenase [Chloroflexota bacterium]
MRDRPSILVAMRPPLFDQLFAEDQQTRLRALGNVTMQPQAGNLKEAQLIELISGQEIVITSWGTPPFSAGVLAAADRLKLIVHSAGSIKLMLLPPVFSDGRRVTHVAYSMSIPVAETTLALILLCLRQFHKIDRAFKEAGWSAARDLMVGAELAGNRVGVIGAGYTGRAVIKRLLALEAEVWLCDPYVSADSAASMGVRKVPLETLMRRCPIVTLQAPATAETYRMIGAEQFGWLRDGAVFINTSRAHLIDEAALLAELRTERISAALDVFDQEPLPDDSPFRELDNLIITPHIAAVTRQSYKRQGQISVDEVAGYLGEGKLRYEVTRDMLDTMA